MHINRMESSQFESRVIHSNSTKKSLSTYLNAIHSVWQRYSGISCKVVVIRLDFISMKEVRVVRQQPSCSKSMPFVHSTIVCSTLSVQVLHIKSSESVNKYSSCYGFSRSGYLISSSLVTQ